MQLLKLCFVVQTKSTLKRELGLRPCCGLWFVVPGREPVGGARPCTTPDGGAGLCDDLSTCPQLLLDLANLRQSICFKSLFVPGVCCPAGRPQE